LHAALAAEGGAPNPMARRFIDRATDARRNGAGGLIEGLIVAAARFALSNRAVCHI
jgi:hypothetical protein